MTPPGPSTLMKCFFSLCTCRNAMSYAEFPAREGSKRDKPVRKQRHILYIIVSHRRHLARSQRGEERQCVENIALKGEHSRADKRRDGRRDRTEQSRRRRDRQRWRPAAAAAVYQCPSAGRSDEVPTLPMVSTSHHALPPPHHLRLYLLCSRQHPLLLCSRNQRPHLQHLLPPPRERTQWPLAALG